MQVNTIDIVTKLFKFNCLSESEYIHLLENREDEELRSMIVSEALRLRKKYYGNDVYKRGLIEFTNYCRNDCNYCGIRKNNLNAQRYRMTCEEILECCELGYQVGFRTFVLQGGEDAFYTDDKVVEIVEAIKALYPDCAVTLSIGEKSYDSYMRYKKAGVDRYLLRHETADEQHYRILHPEEMSLDNRKQCLFNLKKLGYQVGAGFMVGSPGQSNDTLAKDLVFLQQLKPEMVGIGPFVPHCDTVYSDKKCGDIELTLFLLSLVRIILPTALIPATTALATVAEDGRERGIFSGANVVMPNLSPVENRKKYSLYDKKCCTNEEALEGIKSLEKRIENIGYRLVVSRGDAKACLLKSEDRQV